MLHWVFFRLSSHSFAVSICMHCFWAAWLLMGKTETLRGTGDTPFSHLQLWKSIHEGYLRPLLDVLHRIGFYHIFLSHTHLAHTVKKEITALNFLHVNLPFVRLLIPDFIFFLFFRPVMKRDSPKATESSFFGFSNSRIFGQHQNREAVKKGSWVKRKNMCVKLRAPFVSCAWVLKMMNDLSIFSLRILRIVLLGGTL